MGGIRGRVSFGKRKVGEIATDETREDMASPTTEEPQPKRAKTETASEEENGDGPKRWYPGMQVPEGRPRPKFVGEDDEARISGSGTVEDPAIMWLGKMPSRDAGGAIRAANEEVARQAAQRLGCGITHVYIRCAAQASKFVDRDGARIPVWNPDRIWFAHGAAAAAPHLALAFGTAADNLVLHGYVGVAVDGAGRPTGLAASAGGDVEDGEDADGALDLAPYAETPRDCAAYCPLHAAGQAPVDACALARARACPVHGDVSAALDHWCPRARWRTEPLGDHYCPCPHDVAGLADHYCPCPHEGAAAARRHCRHKVSKQARAQHLHYCPAYPF
ncbi:hypothetical protein GGS23DRAFT_599989 [Durotheca rogersii]|uniref:uncharacterized protein n=1 Tax=Durotheca rogersii TaxID=419775 RepID=UPI00222035C7|nr:uncharacterized protein GGS23DRAFT_599989 [Durotheca rogersii]KAI5859801.1 hypothetical protein GGS23DRAFT_599989 [Durotheca rogersii]